MKTCKACKEHKPLTDFRKRSDSSDNHRNICRVCEQNQIRIGKVIDETNNTFGLWKVISRAANKSDGSAQWNCKCACGTEKVVPANTLREGKSLSCGCTRAELGKQKRDLASIENTLFRAYKRGAKDRKYEFSLTNYEFKSLIYSNCIYCGDKPSYKKYFYSYTTGKDIEYYIETNGIDRVDNTKGYTVDNSVTCCKTCNRMKSNISKTLFLDKVRKIYNNIKELSNEKTSNNTESISDISNTEC